MSKATLFALFVILVICLAACQTAVTPLSLSTPGATTVALPSFEPTLPPKVINTLAPPPSPTSITLPTVTLTLIALPTPPPTVHPMYYATINGLRERDYPGGEIRILDVLESNGRYTPIYIDYPSDGLTITGIMQIPSGSGPFPVIILNHGYFDRQQYWSGADTWQVAEYFNDRGYLTIAPDYRSWGGSDEGVSLFHSGLVADVINLVSALPSVPQADITRIGMWGHSMGGGITTKVLTIDPRVKVAVLYAPNSADDADLIARWGPGCLPGQSEEAGDKCNPGEFIPPDLSSELLAAYLATTADSEMLAQIAPVNYLQFVTVPVQIHSGTADGAGLTETPPQWATAVYDALQNAGKESMFYSYPGQGHYFTGDAWVLMMQRAADFFDSKLQ